MRDVEGLLGEGLHDVGFSDEEGLDDGAEGEELEGGLLGHLSFFLSFLRFFGIGIRFVGIRGRDVGEKIGRGREVTGDEDSA